MKEIRLNSPLKGQLIELKDVKDPAFASGAMGKGAAVKDPEGKVFSPVDGTVTVLFGTKHAIGIHSEDGADILIHVGIDTVNLGGKYFDAKIEQGDAIKKGQLLLEFDPEGIKSAGYDTTTPVLVTNAFDYDKITVALGDKEITTVTAEPAEEEAPAAEAPAEPEEDYSDLPKEERVAKLIWKYVGGRDNVRSAEHCATRLRLIINDKSKLNEKAIENIDGVKGQFFAAAQYQIILGTGFVDKVFDAFVAGTGLAGASNNKAEAYAQMSMAQKISRTLGDVFVPIIPVLVATGLFMGLRGASLSLGVQFSDNVLRMSQILTDTAFAFLPALVCWSTTKRFGGTPVIGIVLGLMLVAPQLPNAYAIAAGEAQPIMMDIFGLSVPVVGYQGSVLPALVLGIFAAKLQKWLKTFIPDVIDLIVTPFLTLFISMILASSSSARSCTGLSSPSLVPSRRSSLCRTASAASSSAASIRSSSSSVSTTSSMPLRSSSSPRRASIRSTPSSRAPSSHRAVPLPLSQPARRTRRSALSTFPRSCRPSSASRSRSSSVSTCAS